MPSLINHVLLSALGSFCSNPGSPLDVPLLLCHLDTLFFQEASLTSYLFEDSLCQLHSLTPDHTHTHMTISPSLWGLSSSVCVFPETPDPSRTSLCWGVLCADHSDHHHACERAPSPPLGRWPCSRPRGWTLGRWRRRESRLVLRWLWLLISVPRFLSFQGEF